MLRKFIRRYLPDHNKVKSHKSLSMFGSMLHDPNLWILNRRSAKGAFGIGLFFAFWPVPFQMVLAAGAAIPLRVNLPLSVATVWISNPITMPPIFYLAYLVGSTVLGTKMTSFDFELSWAWFSQSLSVFGPAFLLGCAICSVVAGLIGYFSLDFVWKWSVVKAWEERQKVKRESK
jgi:uncharacterized protein (DUF2062 family)